MPNEVVFLLMLLKSGISMLPIQASPFGKSGTVTRPDCHLNTVIDGLGIDKTVTVAGVSL